MNDYIFFEIDFGTGIKVEKEVLGKTFKFKVHGIDAIMEFPQVSSTLTYDTFSNEKYLFSPERLKGKYGNELDWGEAQQIDKHDKIKVFVSRLILVIPFTTLEEGEKIIDKVDVFTKSTVLFKQYLSIYTRQTFIIKDDNSRPSIKYVTSREKRQKLNMKFNHKYPVVGYSSKASYEAIESSLINKILSYVGHLKELPLEYQLLDEARKLFFQQKYRSTVFECATSAEVLLSIRLKKQVTERNNIYEKKQLDRSNGMNSKFDLATYLKTFKKEYDIPALAKLRNSAIHEGKSIKNEEALKALRITEDFIYSEIDHLF